ERGAEAILRPICEPDRALRILYPNHSSYRTKCLFAEHGHIGAYMIEHCWLVTESGSRWERATEHQDSSSGYPTLHLVMKRVTQIRARHRSDIGITRHRIAHAQSPGGRAEGRNEPVGNTLFNNESLGIHAALAGIDEARCDCDPGRLFDIRVGEHDERV